MSYVMKYAIGEFKNVYRPRSFDYVVGQDGVKKFFMNAFTTNAVPQVILFEGSKGTGKTTMSRIISMALNCSDTTDKRRPYQPCGVCDNCKSILDDSNPDFFEINIADKTGVNDMRSLAESFSYAPMYLDNKIFILDEAHQLSKAAQNKLLKDLEDTPDNIYIILCTTDASSLVDTLIDRCYSFNFSLLQRNQLLTIMDDILVLENRSLNESIKSMLIEVSKGSARSLLVNLHKVLMLGDNIELKEVVGVLGHSAEVAYSIPKIVNNVLNKDFKKFTAMVSKFNPKECNDMCFSMVGMLGSKLISSNPSKRNQISLLIDYLTPCLSIVNKGVFINAVYKFVNSED